MSTVTGDCLTRRLKLRRRGESDRSPQPSSRSFFARANVSTSAGVRARTSKRSHSRSATIVTAIAPDARSSATASALVSQRRRSFSSSASRRRSGFPSDFSFPELVSTSACASPSSEPRLPIRHDRRMKPDRMLLAVVPQACSFLDRQHMQSLHPLHRTGRSRRENLLRRYQRVPKKANQPHLTSPVAPSRRTVMHVCPTSSNRSYKTVPTFAKRESKTQPIMPRIAPSVPGTRPRQSGQILFPDLVESRA